MEFAAVMSEPVKNTNTRQSRERQSVSGDRWRCPPPGPDTHHTIRHLLDRNSTKKITKSDNSNTHLRERDIVTEALCVCVCVCACACVSGTAFSNRLRRHRAGMNAGLNPWQKRSDVLLLLRPIGASRWLDAKYRYHSRYDTIPISVRYCDFSRTNNDNNKIWKHFCSWLLISHRKTSLKKSWSRRKGDLH